MRHLVISGVFFVFVAMPMEAAIRCDSTSDSFNSTTNLPTNTGFTMMGWFKIVTDKNNYSTFFSYGSGVNEKEIQTTVNGTTLMVWDGINEVSGTNLAVGTWYHLALTYDDTNAFGYLNGVLDITNPNTTEPTTTIRTGNDSLTLFLNGRFSCVKVYNVVLTAAQIANEMRHCRPLRTFNLNRWSPTVYNVLAADALDKSGQGADFTVISTPVVESDHPPVSW